MSAQVVLKTKTKKAWAIARKKSPLLWTISGTRRGALDNMRREWARPGEDLDAVSKRLLKYGYHPVKVVVTYEA